MGGAGRADPTHPSARKQDLHNSGPPAHREPIQPNSSAARGDQNAGLREFAGAMLKPAKPEVDVEKDPKLCTVCEEHPKTHLCVPCGHILFCESCSKLDFEECPYCRTAVE